MSSAKTYRSDNTSSPKRSLFDENGKIQIGRFDADLIKLDREDIKAIGEQNARLEKAEVITQEVLQLEFNV
jgi:hypothetical protein